MKKLCNLVMLPSNEASQIHLANTKLYYSKETTYLQTKANQHLYLTVNKREDDESTWIKEGDWYYSEDSNTIIQERQKIGKHINTRCKKIIATTDKSLKIGKELVAVEFGTDYEEYKDKYLPQIPESFVKKFVESQGTIIEVLIEMEEYN
jgi:hypothetical protein